MYATFFTRVQTPNSHTLQLLGELEQHEEDHTLLVAALREDPSGQTIVLEAQRVAAAGGGMSAGLSAGPGSVLTGTTSGVGGEEARSLRLRRLLARLLPPNPFSSGPKAEAAMKLAAWMAAVSRDADGGSVSAGSHLGGAGDVPPGSRRAAAAAHDGPVRAASGRQGGAGVEEMEAEGAQPRRRSKRHKPLSELLAEIPLQEPLRAPAAAPAPGVPSLPGQAAAAPPPPPPAAADQLQQLLLGTGAGLGGDVGGDPLGGALSLLLQQHLSGEQAQAAQAAMEMDDDSLMLRALDAQVGSAGGCWLGAAKATHNGWPMKGQKASCWTCCMSRCWVLHQTGITHAERVLTPRGTLHAASRPTTYPLLQCEPRLPAAPQHTPCLPHCPCAADEQPAAAEREQCTAALGSGGRGHAYGCSTCASRRQRRRGPHGRHCTCSCCWGAQRL